MSDMSSGDILSQKQDQRTPKRPPGRADDGLPVTGRRQISQRLHETRASAPQLLLQQVPRPSVQRLHGVGPQGK